MCLDEDVYDMNFNLNDLFLDDFCLDFDVLVIIRWCFIIVVINKMWFLFILLDLIVGEVCILG